MPFFPVYLLVSILVALAVRTSIKQTLSRFPKLTSYISLKFITNAYSVDNSIKRTQTLYLANFYPLLSGHRTGLTTVVLDHVLEHVLQSINKDKLIHLAVKRLPKSLAQSTTKLP